MTGIIIPDIQAGGSRPVTSTIDRSAEANMNATPPPNTAAHTAKVARLRRTPLFASVRMTQPMTTMTKTASSAGYDLGLLAAAGTLTIIPGAIVIYFVRNYIAKGFAMGRV